MYVKCKLFNNNFLFVKLIQEQKKIHKTIKKQNIE